MPEISLLHVISPLLHVISPLLKIISRERSSNISCSSFFRGSKCLLLKSRYVSAMTTCRYVLMQELLRKMLYMLLNMSDRLLKLCDATKLQDAYTCSSLLLVLIQRIQALLQCVQALLQLLQDLLLTFTNIASIC